MTMRFGISTEPMRAGVSRMFMAPSLSLPGLTRQSILFARWMQRNSGLPEFRVLSTASRVNPTCGVEPGHDGGEYCGVISQHGDLAAVEIDRCPVQPGCARRNDEGYEIR